MKYRLLGILLLAASMSGGNAVVAPAPAHASCTETIATHRMVPLANGSRVLRHETVTIDFSNWLFGCLFV